VSVRVREVAQQAGLFVLLALMAFAFYNDIMRFFTEG
jgi:regulator of sigma E protease